MPKAGSTLEIIKSVGKEPLQTSDGLILLRQCPTITPQLPNHTYLFAQIREVPTMREANTGEVANVIVITINSVLFQCICRPWRGKRPMCIS